MKSVLLRFLDLRQLRFGRRELLLQRFQLVLVVHLFSCSRQLLLESRNPLPKHMSLLLNLLIHENTRLCIALDADVARSRRSGTPCLTKTAIHHRLSSPPTP